MAARCASLGACENAGVAIMSMAATGGAQRFNVLIILGNPYRWSWSRRFNRRQISKSMTEQSDGSIIFGFGFHRKGIVAMEDGRIDLPNKLFFEIR
jgi:hypothetical protein